MSILILGLILFIGVHALPSAPGVRQWLIGRTGEGLYKAVFSLIALAGLALIVIGKGRAETVPLYEPPSWGRIVALWAMPIAFVLTAGAFLPSNIKRYTPHPMLWGVTLWAVLHLSANGDAASLLLFGGIGIYSLYAMWSQNRRGAQRSEKTYPARRDALLVGAGLIAYAAFLALHPHLFGVPAMS
jgi:uncharacterized membrane protein